MNKLEKVIFYILIFIICIVMFFFISKKEGWHCDEIFSYGSSNNRYENLFNTYSKFDATNMVIREDILDDSFIKTAYNIVYYIKNNEQFLNRVNNIYDNRKPIWRSNKEAKDYVMANDNRFNFLSVYYNQARDVHPPLFYFLVHFVSSIFAHSFSKYIIFSISLIFFIAILIVIKKLLQLLGKPYLIIPVIILYGFSMGAISMVMFQRMYTMLTFFAIYFLYLNIQLIKSNFVISNKWKISFISTIVLGFLTQYYFCIYAFFVSLIMIFIMNKLKLRKVFKAYILLLLKSGIVGLIIFPPAIKHIFFSYRGVGSFDNGNYLYRITNYLKILNTNFSINNIFFILTVIIFILALVIYFIKSKLNYKFESYEYLLLIPCIAFAVIIAKISPYVELRYIMCILPMLVIFIVYLIDKLLINVSIKLKQIIFSSIFMILSIYGIIFNTPSFLYIGYNKYIDVAKQYEDLNLVYVTDSTVFNHIKYIPEYMIYKESLILEEGELNNLTTDSKLKQLDEFILALDGAINTDEVLQYSLKATGHNKYELLLDYTNDINKKVYRIYK